VEHGPTFEVLDPKKGRTFLFMKDLYADAQIQIENRRWNERTRVSFDPIAESGMLIDLYRSELCDGIRAPGWRDAFAKTVAITLVNELPQIANIDALEAQDGEEQVTPIVEHTGVYSYATTFQSR
jgi:hypothetical protein